MELRECVDAIPGFAESGHSEKIKAFAWFLHTQRGIERFFQADIRSCYDELHYQKPGNVSPYFVQLQKKRPSQLLKDARGYRLEGRVREAFDTQFGRSESTVAIEKVLAELPGKVSDRAEATFLSEVLTCYRHGAFRSSIVMAWNLAYDHVLNWLLGDAARLAEFNRRVAARFPKKAGCTVARKEDFEDFKESEVIQICSSANLWSKNLGRILEEKLSRRNMAAHPSTVAIVRFQAEDVISDLANNVILRLA